MNVHSSTITIHVIYSQLLWSSSLQSRLQCKGQHKTCDWKPWWERWAWAVGNFLHTEEALHLRVIFCWEKGKRREWEKYEICLRPRVSFCLNKLLKLKIKIGWKRGGYSEGSWRVRMWIEQHRSDSPGWGGISVSSLGSRVDSSDLTRALQLLWQSLMPAWEKPVCSCASPASRGLQRSLFPCLLGRGDVLNQLADKNCTPVPKGW